MPKGTKVAAVGYSHVRGDVLFDPSIPLFGVDSKFCTGIVAYLQTFSLFRSTANVVAELPQDVAASQQERAYTSPIWCTP